MVFKGLIAATAAVALATAPAVAASNSAAALSVAPAVETVEGEQAMGSAWFIAFVALAAVIAGIIVAADDNEDTPKSA